MPIKYLRNLAWIVFFLILCTSQAQAREPQTKGGWKIGLMGEPKLMGRIIEVNEEFNFVVVNLGTANGAEKGMILSVFQKEDEVAKIKISKARKHISACEIQLVYSGRGIGIGDVAIYKEPSPITKMLKPFETAKMIEIEPIVVDIDAPKRTILLNTLEVFKEFGTLVTDSDPAAYVLKANKNMPTPFFVELLSEYGHVVRDTVYYTVEVSSTPKFNRLIIHLRGVYEKEGSLYNHEIKKTSSVYKEAQEMAFTIKDLSERL